MRFLRRKRLEPLPPPCLELDTCALTLGFQWCTCYAPVNDAARKAIQNQEPA
jgi:hypothetical protein